MFDTVEVASAPGERLDGYGHYTESYRLVDGAWRTASMRLTRLRVDRVLGET